MFSGIIVGVGSVAENNQHTHRLAITSEIWGLGSNGTANRLKDHQDFLVTVIYPV